MPMGFVNIVMNESKYRQTLGRRVLEGAVFSIVVSFLAAANSNCSSETLPDSANPNEPATESAAADELNVQGMKLYRNKDYEGASVKFLAVVDKSPANAKAAYNLACMYSLIYRENPCGPVIEVYGDELRRDALRYLGKSIRLDPGYIKKALRDKDLEPIRNLVGFKYLTGQYDPSNPESVRAVLIAAKHWVRDDACGTMGCPGIEFIAAGIFLYREAPGMEEHYNKSSADEPGRERGTFEVHGNQVRLFLESGETREFPVPDKDGKMGDLRDVATGLCGT